MKTIIALLMSFGLSAHADSPDARPVGSCLATLSAAMKAVGTSQIAQENEIDFEGFLDQQGSRFTFMYYKSTAGSETLDIEGVGAADLVIKRSSVDRGLLDIEECDVANAQIIREVRESGDFSVVR